MALFETMESCFYIKEIVSFFSMLRVSSLLFLDVHHLHLCGRVPFQNRVVS